jgi:hypothetical protein
MNGVDQDEVRGVVLEDVEVAQHRVRRAPIPLGDAAAGDVRLEQLHATAIPVEVPRPAQADMVVERTGVVLGQHDHVVDVGVDAVRQGEVDDPVLPAERDSRLRPLLRQDGEPLTFAAREDDRHRLLQGSASTDPDLPSGFGW